MYTRHSFPNQKPDEHVLMFLRRHWIAVVKIILLTIGLSAMPPVAYIGLNSFTQVFSGEIYKALFTLLISSFYLFVVLFAFSNFVDYYLDIWIITNQRVVNIEQKGLFSREIAEKDLGQMQDIMSDVDGFWPTVLNYGNIHIQTAGNKERFIFKQIPFATEVAQRISNLVSEYNKLNHTPKV